MKKTKVKLKRFLYSTLATFVLILTYSYAVSQDSTRHINFKVVNEISGYPVELAHIINKSKKEVAISDLLGYFTIPFSFGDSLSITSLGYLKKELLNLGQYSNDSIFYTITLTPRAYEIKELQFKWFATYDGFLKGFLNLKLPVTKEEKDVERIKAYFGQIISNLDLKNLPSGKAGATFGKDWLNKQNKDLEEKLEKERKQRIIARKFSAGIVEALTGLKGNEVFWFMEYCGFTNEYILNSSDYSIRLRIMDKFKIYNQDKVLKENK